MQNLADTANHFNRLDNIHFAQHAQSSQIFVHNGTKKWRKIPSRLEPD
jgi:hypothetical protein